MHTKTHTLLVLCVVSCIGLIFVAVNRLSHVGAQQSSTVTLVQSFDGTSGPGYKDHPDLGGAVGPNHVVDFVGASFVVHDKTTGNVVQQMSQTQFWQNSGVAPGTLNDPRLIFDPLSNRWYGVSAGPSAFLAVSADSDPTHAWKGVTLTNLVSGDLLVKPAADANGFYACFYGGSTNSICVAIPKNDLLWSGSSTPSLANEAIFTNLPYELVPAMDPNPSKATAAPEFVITRQGTQNSSGPMSIQLLKITWAGTTASISSTQTIPTGLNYSVPGPVPQLGSSTTIKAQEDHRFLNVFAVGSSVWGLMGTQVGSHVGANWFEINGTTGAIVQSGVLADPTYDILFPTVAADANGNIGIGFTKVSPTENASVYVASRLAGDPPGTLRPPVLMAAGIVPYTCSNANPVGWGTYSSSMRDPSNPAVLWTYQEYAHSTVDCQWSTRWVAYSIAGTALPPPTPVPAHLVLLKSVDKVTGQPGDILTYTLTVANTTSLPASPARIVDAVPANTTFVSASDNGVLQNGTVIWDLPAGIGSNSSQSVSLQLKVN